MVPPINVAARPDEDGCGGAERVLTCEQWLPEPIDDVFELYAEPANLERITPGFLHFRVLAVSTPRVRLGTVIDYRLRLHGVPIRWRSRIERWEPGRCFADRQVRGPYALWHHLHEFESRRGGTVVRDTVRYRLPLGWLGRLVAGRLVARDLHRIFEYRRRATAAVLAAPGAKRAR